MCPFTVRLHVHVLWAWPDMMTGWCVHSEWDYLSMWCGLDLTWWLGDVSIQSETTCPCGVGLTWHDDWVMCPFRVRLLVHVVWAWPDMMTGWCVHSEWDYLSMWCGLDLTWRLGDVSIHIETTCPRGVGLNQHGDWVVCPFIVKLLVHMLWAWTWWLDGVSMNSETTCPSVVGLNLNDDGDVSIHGETFCPCVVGRVVCPCKVRLLVCKLWALIWWPGSVSMHSVTKCPCFVGLNWHDCAMCPFISRLLVRGVWAWTDMMTVMYPFKGRLLVCVFWAWPDMMTVWCDHSYWDYLSSWCGLEPTWWLSDVSIHSEATCLYAVGLTMDNFCSNDVRLKKKVFSESSDGLVPRPCPYLSTRFPMWS